MVKYKIVLLKDNKQVGKYNINEDMFNNYKKQLEPYIVIRIPFKQVLCVETGEIFKNVHQAGKWVVKNELTNSYSVDEYIRATCLGKRKTAYGYNWKYL